MTVERESTAGTSATADIVVIFGITDDLARVQNGFDVRFISGGMLSHAILATD